MVLAEDEGAAAGTIGCVASGTMKEAGLSQ
jgi:hypothetical protein